MVISNLPYDMKYTSFYIKNYKGIKELELSLNRDPKTHITTLVGLNESGKTTILEAISMHFNQPIETEVHKLIPKSRKSQFTDTIEISATLELDENDNKLISDFAKKNGFASISDINTYVQKYTFAFKDSLFDKDKSGWSFNFDLAGTKKGGKKSKKWLPNSEEYRIIQEYIDQNLLPVIEYYPNFLFDFPDRIYLEKTTTEDKEQETYRAVLNDVLDSLNKGLNMQKHVIDRIKNPSEANDDALDATLEEMSAQISKTVFDSWGKIFESTEKKIVLKAGIDTVSKLTYIDFKLKEGKESFQISERSLGFKWFFTFLLFTEFRKNRKSENGEILFLLDEPASNLHSTAQKKLLSTFENLVTSCKLIYTTHSHHLINPKWLSGTYIVKNKAVDYENIDSNLSNTDVEAIIYKQFVVKHPDQKTYFQPILDAIDYSPSNLEEVPNIVLTEGKNDYYTFKYFSEIILKDNNYNIAFYPGNSANRNNQIIAMYLAWAREFTILLDGDSAGVKAKDGYLKEFGKILSDKIITLKDIDESYTFATEELFTKEEQMLMINSWDPEATSFNKSKFNTAIQNLYINEVVISVSETTKQKFIKILEFLK